MLKSNEQYALCVKDYGQCPDVLSLFIAGKKEYLVLETIRSVGKSASWSVGQSFIW